MVYEYLKNATKEDLEKDIYLIYQMNETLTGRLEILYPASIDFDKGISGNPPSGWE